MKILLRHFLESQPEFNIQIPEFFNFATEEKALLEIPQFLQQIKTLKAFLRRKDARMCTVKLTNFGGDSGTIECYEHTGWVVAFTFPQSFVETNMYFNNVIQISATFRRYSNAVQLLNEFIDIYEERINYIMFGQFLPINIDMESMKLNEERLHNCINRDVSVFKSTLRNLSMPYLLTHHISPKGLYAGYYSAISDKEKEIALNKIEEIFNLYSHADATLTEKQIADIYMKKTKKKKVVTISEAMRNSHQQMMDTLFSNDIRPFASPSRGMPTPVPNGAYTAEDLERDLNRGSNDNT